MSGLQKKVFHDCQMPVLDDPLSRHRWECPDCHSTWEWLRSLTSPTRVERYGFLGLRSRTVPRPQEDLGFWMALERRFAWEPA